MRARVKILYMTQGSVAPPTFVLFTNRGVELHFSYQRFLDNQIREAFGFLGTPIWIKNRARNQRCPCDSGFDNRLISLLSRHLPIHREQSHSLDASVVRHVDHVGHVLEIDIGVAAHENYFLGAR
jgi:hypothetical protein